MAVLTGVVCLKYLTTVDTTASHQKFVISFNDGFLIIVLSPFPSSDSFFPYSRGLQSALLCYMVMNVGSLKGNIYVR